MAAISALRPTSGVVGNGRLWLGRVAGSGLPMLAGLWIPDLPGAHLVNRYENHTSQSLKNTPFLIWEGDTMSSTVLIKPKNAVWNGGFR